METVCGLASRFLVCEWSEITFLTCFRCSRFFRSHCNRSELKPVVNKYRATFGIKLSKGTMKTWFHKKKVAKIFYFNSNCFGNEIRFSVYFICRFFAVFAESMFKSVWLTKHDNCIRTKISQIFWIILKLSHCRRFQLPSSHARWLTILV